MASYNNQIDYSISDSEWHGISEGQIYPSKQQFKELRFKDMQTFQIRNIEFKNDGDKVLRSLKFTFADDDDHTVMETPTYGEEGSKLVSFKISDIEKIRFSQNDELLGF